MPHLTPGLLVLQGNRLELLREAVFDWVGSHPLGPLEEEVFLVQSNGVAEWLKMTLAASQGICAATRVELPARFLWRSYRQVLGPAAVPARATMDKTALTWRVLQLLPAQLGRPEFAPLSRFLAGGDWGRRLQLAERVADLFDQYQVYRSDWLGRWATGSDSLPAAHGERALPDDQRWQPLLWRELVASLGADAMRSSRPELHDRFVQALAAGEPPVLPVPRRIVLFGVSSVPQQTLAALEALSRRSQVILAIPNPCRFHWADIIDGRELLRSTRRRHPHRAGLDLSSLPLEDMHAHANPLLAGWGRQGRDFVRQLDGFDAAALGGQVAVPRVDLFDEGPGHTLLTQVQACVRDLVPLCEPVTAERAVPDRSIAFHIAHSAQREVEILHDQLLALLADPPGGSLAPRDIVVMVPDVETFAPAVRAVFGQYGRSDARHIPFSLADLRQRSTNPLLVALEWLLRLPHQRAGLSELESLLDVPAIAARFGIEADDLPLLRRWMQGAGIRWGVSAAQRAEIGLDCGEQNSWLFGLQRMLLGFTSGPAADFAGIEPFAEIGGLESSLVGSLAAVVAAVGRWNDLAGRPARPSVWGERLTDLMAGFLKVTDDAERQTLASLQDAMRGWLEAAEAAGFDDEIPLTVVREAWLAGVDQPSLAQRFISGGVTFCTLLPMRAVPFEVVCLLGMNDGDYPRATVRSDFDLMALPGQRRPGDRSRRDDDRYLMLEAVLSARQVLYLSWTGRSVRDNAVQPPSVLVGQLRDYLSAGWGAEVVDAVTTEHPLQPFSRRYFEAGSALRTYAGEWREAHASGDIDADADADAVSGRDADLDLDLDGRQGRSARSPGRGRGPEPAPSAPDAVITLTFAHLGRFLKNPVKAYFRHRLEVQFDELPEPVADAEAFDFDGLQNWLLIDGLVAQPERTGEIDAALRSMTDRLLRAGRLPMAAIGERVSEGLAAVAAPMLRAWRLHLAAQPHESGPVPLRDASPAGLFEDWLGGLRHAGTGGAPRTDFSLTASELLTRKGDLRPHTFITAWVRALAAAACGEPVAAVVVGRDAAVALPVPSEEVVAPAWAALLDAWRDGMSTPLPMAPGAGIAFIRDPASAATVYEGVEPLPGELREPCLARTYPDFETLTADGRFAHWAPRLYGPLLHWLASAVTTPHGPVGRDAVAAAPAQHEGAFE